MSEPVASTARQGANLPEYSVSELSFAIKRTLEGAYGYVRLKGEISGFRGTHSSGHCYFALKDDKAKIEAVVWRTTVQALRIKPAEGLEVIATGRITTFPGSSRYQIVIDALEPAGVGALMALLEERRKKLAAEGLFAEGKKRRLPFLPRVIGVVTSPTGAVIRDMLAGFTERFPARVLVWPVRVQGETSAAEVAAAIRGFNAIPPGGRIPRPDVLIVARGGGSLEDLWGFNEEIVVRAAAESQIPLISAVGHETDWTLIDLAADARAPTPTKAAEWAVPKYADLVEQTGKLSLRLATAARRALDGMRAHYRAAARGLPRRSDLIALPRQRFDAVERSLAKALRANTQKHATRLTRVAVRLAPRLLEFRMTRRREHLTALARAATASLARVTGPKRARLERVAGRIAPHVLSVRLARAAERTKALDERATRSLVNSLAWRRGRLDGAAQLLASLGYRSVLRRGFALVRTASGAGLRSVAQARPGDKLDIELADGRIFAAAETLVPSAPPARPAPGTPAETAQSKTVRAEPVTRTKGGNGNQGSLF